jgi:predicted permease
MRQLIHYQRQAWANLKKKTAFVATVVVTMGTTLGALLCVLTLGHLLLIEPLPYPEQNRLYRVGSLLDDNKGEVNIDAFTYPGLIHLYKNQDVFEEAALAFFDQDVLSSLPHQPSLTTGYVTPEWFSLLDAKPIMGRLFEKTEALDTNNPGAILTYKTWQQEFGSREDILEHTVSFSGVSFRIVGVLSKDFVEPQISRFSTERSIWLPWDYNLDTRNKESWGRVHANHNFLGRIKEGISAAQAEQALTPLINSKWQEEVASDPFFKGWTISSDIKSLKDVIVNDSRRMIMILTASVLGLVIIAFTNITNLFMSRTAEQQRQLAIYAALGAKKSHLLKVLLAESSLLMAFAILLALIIAAFGFHLMQTHFADAIPRTRELSLNIFTFGSGILFASLFALSFAYISSRMINYKNLNAQVQSSGKGTGIQVSKRFRRALVASQITVAMVLVFANIGLFNVSYKIIKAPLGFEINHMISLIFTVSTNERLTNEQVAPVMTAIKNNLSALPTVKSVSQSDSPLDGFTLVAVTNNKTNESYTPGYKEVDASYFEQISQKLVAGRFISEEDTQDAVNSAVVNEVFAHNLSVDGDVLGMQLDASGYTYTIVGIVESIRLPGESDIPNRIYFPANLAHAQINLTIEPNLHVTREQVVAAIKEVNSQYALYDLQILPQAKDKQLFVQYVAMITTSTLAIITLFLTGVGLYGIISYGTQMRRFEIGTRMAIGAKPRNLIHLIVHDNARVVGIGFVLSIILLGVGYLAYGDSLTAYINSSLIPVFAITLISICVLALFACYWPLRKYINNPAIHLLRGSE